jgi:hypothetical protein
MKAVKLLLVAAALSVSGSSLASDVLPCQKAAAKARHEKETKSVALKAAPATVLKGRTSIGADGHFDELQP